MWIYEKRLLYPVKIKRANPRMAKYIAMLYGGPAGELTAGITYLNQRYHMPDDVTRAILTDIGTEELAHWEMLGAMMAGCLKGASCTELVETGMDAYYINHDSGAFPVNSTGEVWTAAYVGSTGDAVADLTNDMAAEQKARAGYEAVMRICDDPDILAPLQFLRMREIVHYQRFGEALDRIQSMSAPR